MTGKDASMDNQVYLLISVGVGALVSLGFILALVYYVIAKYVFRKSTISPILTKIALSAPIILAVVYGVAIQVLPQTGESLLNKVFYPLPEFTPSQEVIDFHNSLTIVDWHADSLMWTYRDLTQRSSVGHVDLPRLQEGNIAIQGMGSVTKVPLFMSFDKNTNKTDAISLVAFFQQWPLSALKSLTARAVLLAERLHELASHSNGVVHVLKYKEDVGEFLEKRKSNKKLVGTFLGIEGAQALDGKFSNVDKLFELGYRVIGPAHFFDTELGGSAHGEERYGLTEFGRRVIARMEELGIFVDIAHSSMAVINDVLAIAKKPIVATHSGVKAICNNSRTFSDEQLLGIAKTGGIVGITFFKYATCGDDVESIARSIKYTSDLIGAKHVALGSDYDGSVVVPFDASQMIRLTDALLKVGMSKEDIRLVMGESTVAFLSTNLPSRP